MTWWPVPYWTDRFNHLADRPEADFEAVFLAPGGAEYDGMRIEPSEWRFRYRILQQSRSDIGFYRHRRLPGNPLPIVRGSDVRLVMTYADPTYLAAAALANARRLGYHLFVPNTLHDTRPDSTVRTWAKQWAFRNARKIFVTGPLQAEYARVFAPGTPLVEIGNPVDPGRLGGDVIAARRPAVRRARGWSDDDVVLLFVGRLAPEKDLATLVRAASLLGRRDVVLAVCGSGPLEAELVRLAGELGVRLDLCGFLNGEELGEVYAAADLFVLPSTSEPWGLVVNEAMHASLPVVVSDHVGARPLVEPGRNGDIFAAGDANDLARALRPLVSDRERRAAAGSAAREAIERHTIARWADVVLEAVGLR